MTGPRAPAFLESEFPSRDPDAALFHVHPVPLEATVSYGVGTGRAPAAILEASQQLETWDGRSVPGAEGIHTAAPVDCSGDLQAVFDAVSGRVTAALSAERIPVLLGGEHSITNGGIRALAALSEPVGIVQVDAHDDLRDQYGGTPWSHACVMRRALDAGICLCQVGLRALSPEALRLRRERAEQLVWFDAEGIARDGPGSVCLPAWFPRKVYLSVDVDGLDPAVIAATGTPEPGGLGWWDLMAIVEGIAGARQIVGFDVVELAPMAGFEAATYAAARLTYNLMGFAARSRFR